MRLRGCGSQPDDVALGLAVELGVVERIDEGIGVPAGAQRGEFAVEALDLAGGDVAAARFRFVVDQRGLRAVEVLPAGLAELEAEIDIVEGDREGFLVALTVCATSARWK